MTAVLNPVHLKEEKHTQDEQTMQKQLTDKGFVLRVFFGGYWKSCYSVSISFGIVLWKKELKVPFREGNLVFF